MKAPWTPQQVESLNRFQKSGIFHPFTCANGHGDLVATEAGWICPSCPYTQEWATPEMADDAMLDEMIKARGF